MTVFEEKKQLLNFYSTKITICNTYFLLFLSLYGVLILILACSHHRRTRVNSRESVTATVSAVGLFPLRCGILSGVVSTNNGRRGIGPAFAIAKTICTRLWDSCSLFFIYSFSHSIRCGCVIDSSWDDCGNCCCACGCGKSCCCFAVIGIGIGWRVTCC